MENILQEARWLAENGVTELVVVAQDTTRYGEDIYGKSMLPQLLEELCRIDGFKWIRTLYCYPERITDELLEVIAKEDKLVKQPHTSGTICFKSARSRQNTNSLRVVSGKKARITSEEIGRASCRERV